MRKKKVVVLSGAGMSAESGLKTFRDTDGLWEGYDIEDVATARAWKKNPHLVLEFYNMRRRNVRDAQPNAGHTGLAALEEYFDVSIITQNIDDLHERAGSTHVLHLHGEIFKMRSERNDQMILDVQGDIRWGDKAPDGAQLRPHIVWFEEPVPMMETAVPLVMAADIFVVVGTSLAVYPAAGLIHFAPHDIEKYIIDKRVPASGMLNIIAIEQPATGGVRRLTEILLEKHT